MTTRAKMASASAMPRSLRINRSVQAISQENPGGQLLHDRNAGCRVLAADALQCQLDASDRAGNSGGKAESIGVVEPKAIFGQGTEERLDGFSRSEGAHSQPPLKLGAVRGELHQLVHPHRRAGRAGPTAGEAAVLRVMAGA